MMGYTPVFGSQIRYALLGSKEISGETLLRWYALHVLMLPFVIVIFMAVHLWRVRKDGGISGPLYARNGGEELMPEVPEHLLKRSPERRKALGLPVEGEDGDDATTPAEAPAADAGAAEPVEEVAAAASDAGEQITEDAGGVPAHL